MLKVLLHSIDTVNEWMGKSVGWVIIPLSLIIVLETTLRYAFNSPTIWAWDVEVQLQAFLVALGGGYALLKGSHVNVDVIITKLSPRKRALIDSITGPILIAALSILLWKAGPYTWLSIQVMEHDTSTWAPPIYPLKTIIFIGILLMLLQGIAKWLRDLMRVLQRGAGGK